MTLPKSLRDRYGLERGDALSILDLGGVFVLSPQASGVDAAANEIAAVRKAAGVPKSDLLNGLQNERERYVREHYPHEPRSVPSAPALPTDSSPAHVPSRPSMPATSCTHASTRSGV